MTRSVRAPVFAAALLVLLTQARGAARAQAPAPASQPAGAGTAALYRQLKLFDFDERPQENYEDTPMHWEPLTGPGLPTFSRGRFDWTVGHASPPSFGIHLRGGNVAYEYAQTDLAVEPDSDYLVEAAVRCVGLTQAGALLACYLVDADGVRIESSEHASNVARSLAGQPDNEPWQTLQVILPGEFPNAAFLRIQLWVAQNDTLFPGQGSGVDPIVHQEVDGRVWFDDLAITRMPRVRLTFSNPGGLVTPGEAAAFQIDAYNATLAAVRLELRVTDAQEAAIAEEARDLAARAAGSFSVALPELPPGLYRADLRLLSMSGEQLMRRTLRIAVLPQLFAEPARFPELGVDLGRWVSTDARGAEVLVRTLGCGAVKIGLPLAGRFGVEGQLRLYQPARDLARTLAISQIETTGVLLAPAALDSRGESTQAWLLADESVDADLGPVLAYFGGHFTTWQLGREAVELTAPLAWDAEAIGHIRRRLARFIALPQLVIPRSVLDVQPAAAVLTGTPPETPDTTPVDPWVSGLARDNARPYAFSYWAPASLPAAALPWHLAFWFADESTSGQGAAGARGTRTVGRWLGLEFDRSPAFPPDERLADMARRLVLAKAVSPDRLYVPAPFEPTSAGGSAAWQPTEEYIPLRTLVHHLSGLKIAAALQFPGNAVGLLFAGRDTYTLVVWSWDADVDPDAHASLYVGTVARAVNLHGLPEPLPLEGPRATIPLRPEPLIIANVDGPLLLLHNSFRLEPRSIQLHDPEPRPVLYLHNQYGIDIAGSVTLTPPGAWQVAPNPIRFQLRPGEVLAQTLTFTIPPRQVASTQPLGIDVHLLRPDLVTLHLESDLVVELRDIGVNVSAAWDGDALVIVQTLSNESEATVSFAAFCQPYERSRLEGAFLAVPPGEVRVQTYRVPAARDLAGSQLWLGIQEIGGRRTLDQLVQAPD